MMAASVRKPFDAYAPSRVVDLGRTKAIFVSGLTTGGDAPNDTRAQAKIVFDEMAALLRAAGSSTW